MEGVRLSQANILARKLDDEAQAPRAAKGALGPKPHEPSPRVLRCEGYTVESWVFERERTVTLTASERAVHLIVPTQGQIEVVAEGVFETVRPGSAMLLAQHQPALLVRQAGSAGALVSLPRHRLQAHASRLFAEPLRLAPLNTRFEPVDEAGGLVEILQSLRRPVAARLDPGREIEGPFTRRLALAVVEALGRDPASGALTPARSVKRAIDHVRACTPGELDAERLAAAAGVTERTLRENFRAVLGQSVQAFIQEARLQWAHDRLASAKDPRPVEAFAAAAGFGSSGAFARAYQKKFGETPSVTRARAVRAAGRP